MALVTDHGVEELQQVIGEQLAKGAVQLFDCHQRDRNLCAGWVGVRGAHELLAMRLHADKVHPSVWRYESPVPLFASGQEACDHGKRELVKPGEIAGRMIKRLLKTIPTSKSKGLK